MRSSSRDARQVGPVSWFLVEVVVGVVGDLRGAGVPSLYAGEAAGGSAKSWVLLLGVVMGNAGTDLRVRLRTKKRVPASSMRSASAAVTSSGCSSGSRCPARGAISSFAAGSAFPMTVVVPRRGQPVDCPAAHHDGAIGAGCSARRARRGWTTWAGSSARSAGVWRRSSAGRIPSPHRWWGARRRTGPG